MKDFATVMNTRIMYLQKTDRMLLLAIFLMLFTLGFSLPASFAQGLPLIRNYTAAEYGGHNRNFDIEIGEDGTVFVANFDGLLYYDRAQWRMIHTSDSCHITVLYRDSKNTIWVGGHHYFARLQNQPNGELFLQQVGGAGLFKGGVMEIFEKDGSLQFLVRDGKVFEVKGGDDQALPTVSQKKQADVRLNSRAEAEIVSQVALMNNAENADIDEITQTETLDGGLKVKVKKNQGLIIADDQDNDLYAITESNGLCSNQVSHVTYDGHGVLWGTTLHGIFAIELPSVYSYLLPKDGLTGEVHAITAFDDKIYVGSTNGLYVVSSRRCELLPGINNICWILCEYRDGLLAATSQGIYRIARGGHISRLTPQAATEMLVKDDKVYAGEPDGVWLYQSDFQQRTKVNGLRLVTDIRQDERGGLWFKNVHGEVSGTEKGSLPPYKTPIEENLPLTQLPQQLFMPVSKIEVKALYRYGNQIWIGGDEILAIIDMSQKELTKLADNRTIRFRSIILNNDSILWGGYGDMPKALPKLGSDDSHLHFFYALDYAPLTGKPQYRYRLNDSQWSAWTEKQDVEFPNLFYGPYTLSVQAQLANGELSDVTTIGFSIAYPLLMRWYMVVLYLLIFAYLLYLLFRYRLKRLEKEKIKLERIVEERTADLRNAQHELIRQEKMATVGKLTEGLIDRILNPMNFIIYFSKMSNDLLKDLKENFDHNKDKIDEDDYEDSMDLFNNLAEVQQNLDKYGKNTTRMLKAMEEMLKDRTGGYVDMDLQDVLHQSQEMFGQNFAKEIEQYNIQTVFSLPSGAITLHGNPDMLSKAIMSLLGNAVYAVVKKSQKAPYDPEVSLSATVADGSCVLKVRDNGIGIDEKIIGKVFDPFFTTKTTDEAAGVGLYLSREIIQNHKGDISVASVKNDYTEFTISLPIQQTT